jgi:hypothetical protein
VMKPSTDIDMYNTVLLMRRSLHRW